eukprot:5497036-Prymnesium_polylepis.1
MCDPKARTFCSDHTQNRRDAPRGRPSATGVKNLAVSSRAASGRSRTGPSGPALSLHFKRVVGHERS